MPLVSIIIPLYRSAGTLAGCLGALRTQTHRDFEVILVDSTPDDGCRRIAAEQLPESHYLHSHRRLLPQEARNLGAEASSGAILVFTDPDIYPSPSWLQSLVSTHQRFGAVVFGPVACAGRRVLHVGAHLTKFHICLPGGTARKIQLGWSGNMLIARSVFQRAGGFSPHVQGDSVLSAKLAAQDECLLFDPRAVVFHDHEGLTMSAFLSERFSRGLEYGNLTAEGLLGGNLWTRREEFLHALACALLPLQILQSFIRIGFDAGRSGLIKDFLRVFPVVLLGRSAWGLGVKAAYLGRLGRRSVNPRSPDPRSS